MARDPNPTVLSDELEKCRADVRLAKTLLSPDWIICLECGRLLGRISAQHLRRHDLTQALYKEKWGYNLGSGLASQSLSKVRAVVARKMRLARVGRRNLRPFARKHAGYVHRREGNLNNASLHAGKPKPGNRKLIDGRSVSDLEIAEARLQGDALDSIAARTGLSATAILFRLRRLKFPCHTGRRPAFEHGAPMTGQAIADLLEGSNVTALGLTRRMGLSPSALYPHLRRPGKTLPFDLARAIKRQRRSLVRRAPSDRGGRPTVLLPADLRTLRAKYQALHEDLALVRRWVSERDCRIKSAELHEWICSQTRTGKIRTLLFWPEFFQWCRKVSPSREFLGSWRPQEIAFDFLADDYGVKRRAISKAVFGS